MSLANGQTYAASKLIMEGEPQDGSIADDPKATCLTARIPGRQIEARLHSKDEHLRVVWRAMMHDGDNYIRQQIDVTALKEDCQIKEIAWFNAAVSNNRLTGRVDGSPIVAGNFFFGCEDPMALNTVSNAVLSIGNWGPEDLKPGRRYDKTWPVNASWLKPGDKRIHFPLWPWARTVSISGMRL